MYFNMGLDEAFSTFLEFFVVYFARYLSEVFWRKSWQLFFIFFYFCNEQKINVSMVTGSIIILLINKIHRIHITKDYGDICITVKWIGWLATSNSYLRIACLSASPQNALGAHNSWKRPCPIVTLMKFGVIWLTLEKLKSFSRAWEAILSWGVSRMWLSFHNFKFYRYENVPNINCPTTLIWGGGAKHTLPPPAFSLGGPCHPAPLFLSHCWGSPKKDSS